VPAFRKKNAPVTPKCEADKRDAAFSELSAVFGKMHRRANSSGNTGVIPATDNSQPTEITSKTMPAEKPTTKTITAQRMEKVEPAKKNFAEKPTSKSTAAQCTEKSELEAKLSMRADVSVEKDWTKVGKVEEKLSKATGSGEQSTVTNDVEIQPKLKALTKPTPPAKSGLVTENVPSHLPVVKLVSAPGSVASDPYANDVPSREHTETDGESVAEKTNIFQVKPKKTCPSPTPTAQGLETTRDAEKNKQENSSLTTSRKEPQVTLRNSKSDADLQGMTGSRVDSETTESGADNKAINAGLKTTTDRTTANENGKQSPGFLAAKSTWEQKSPSSMTLRTAKVTKSSANDTESEKSQTTEQSDTAAERSVITVSSEADNLFVPVSKRAKAFGSSVLQNGSNGKTDSDRTEGVVKTTGSAGDRQYVGKATGYAPKTTAAAVNCDRNVQTDSSQTTVVGKTDVSRASSTSSCSTDPQSLCVEKASITKTKSYDTSGSFVRSTTQSVQPSQRGTCEAKNEVVINAVSFGSWPPTKSDVKTSVPSSVKPSGTSSPKTQPRTGSVKTASNTAEPDKAAGSKSAVTQNVSSVTSRVKPSGTSLPKHLPRDSPPETANTVVPGKVSSSFLSAQSEKPSTKGSALSTEVMTSVESTSSEPKVTSTNTGAPVTSPGVPVTSPGPPVTSSVVDLAKVKFSDQVVKPKRNFGSKVTTEPVTSTDPPWMALAQKKTQARVWTEGKI